MLTLTIKGENYEDLQRKILEAATEIYEQDERGFYDEGEDTWVLNKEDYKLEYDEGTIPLKTIN